MLSDDELKEIEGRPERAHSFAKHPNCGCSECIGFDTAYEKCAAPLLAEVKRLRQQLAETCCVLCGACLRDDEPAGWAWQAVADGATPDPDTWYAARIHHAVNSPGDPIRSITYHAVHMPGGEGFANVTHFLVIPPPPIKRES